MLVLFVVLAGLSLVALIAGFAWTLSTRGTAKKAGGPEAGANVMAGLEETPAGSVTLVEGEAQAFRGTAVAVSVEADISFAWLKQALRERRWRDALPTLLAALGLVGLLLFGSLALLVGLQNKLIGAVFFVLVVYTMVRVVLDWRKA